MENEAYKEIVSGYILSSNPTQISVSTLLNIYEQLKELNKKDLIKVFKLIEVIKQMILDDNNQKAMTSQLNDELLKEIKEIIQAHQTNIKFLGYSPLIGCIFNYYVYIKYFKSDVQKFQKLIKPLEDELKPTISEDLRNSTDRIVKKFYRFNGMRFANHKDILVSEKRKNIVKNNIEMIYKKKIHKDTFQIGFIKILSETKLLSLKNANEISRKLFDTKNYIDESYFQKSEVENFINRVGFILYLSITTGIHLPNNYVRRVE